MSWLTLRGQRRQRAEAAIVAQKERVIRRAQPGDAHGDVVITTLLPQRAVAADVMGRAPDAVVVRSDDRRPLRQDVLVGGVLLMARSRGARGQLVRDVLVAEAVAVERADPAVIDLRAGATDGGVVVGPRVLPEPFADGGA